MKKLYFVFAIIFTFTVSLSAQGKQDVTVVNKTGVIINELHISPNDVDEWGEDILGQDVLDLDQECDIQFHPKEDVCLWDLKITDSDGNAIEWEKIDLCKALKIVLHWDGTKAWADIEE
ncbi:MAG: hypothetical protein AB1394_11420 [Bacteroidota bacterium]